MTVVDPIRDERGWAFRNPSGKIPPGAPFESTDPINGFQFLSEAYKATDPDFDERVTVPVLWDKETKKNRQQLRRRHLPDVQRRLQRARAK